MLAACVNLKACDACIADCVVGKHTLDCESHGKLGLCSHESLVLNFLETADIAGVAAIVLLSELLACENSLGSIDYDNEFAAIHMRCEFGAMLASENVGSGNGGFTEGFSCGVAALPFAFQSSFFSHESGNLLFLRCIFL